MDLGIEPHIPVWDKSGETKGKFTKADFTYDKDRDLYICPGGKILTTTGKIDQGRILPYRASTKALSRKHEGLYRLRAENAVHQRLGAQAQP